MSKVQEYHGVVIARSTNTPGPASGITYTVQWDMPDVGTITHAGCAPSQRWPDAIDTVPYDVSDPTKRVKVKIIDIEGYWLFQFEAIELPDTEEC